VNKHITIYDKNGNEIKINQKLKTCFVGKGFFLTDPTKKKEEK